MILTRKNSILVMVVTTAICLLVGDAMAQGGGRVGRAAAGERSASAGSNRNTALRVVSYEAVQQHLELLPAQTESLKQLAEKDRADRGKVRRDKSASNGGKKNSADRAATQAKTRKALRGVTEETEKKIDSILNPEQSKRLSQLIMQRRLPRGISSVFESEKVSDQLGISNAERKELHKKARDAQKALRENITKLRRSKTEKKKSGEAGAKDKKVAVAKDEKVDEVNYDEKGKDEKGKDEKEKAGKEPVVTISGLREQMQADLLKELSPTQQAAYTSLVGESFKFAPEQRPQRAGRKKGSARHGGGKGKKAAK
jgi:hypothetical protein